MVLNLKELSLGSGLGLGLGNGHAYAASATILGMSLGATALVVGGTVLLVVGIKKLTALKKKEKSETN